MYSLCNNFFIVLTLIYKPEVDIIQGRLGKLQPPDQKRFTSIWREELKQYRKKKSTKSKSKRKIRRKK